jgi:hypothetical protein
MRIQLLSDLHLETETDFDPQPVPGADVLVLAGDIDSTWAGLERFAGWPQPVLFVAGNHEFDRRELDDAWPALRERCAKLGFTMLECERVLLTDGAGCRVRFAGTVRWSDYELHGALGRERAMRASGYFMRLMGATRGGAPFDAMAMREESLACRAWLESELAEPAAGRWDATVVITHFAPSARSADPRYGAELPASASFCNADDDLLAQADLWLHGHLHCRHDWLAGATRVVSQARGHSRKGETAGYDAHKLIDLSLRDTAAVQGGLPL